MTVSFGNSWTRLMSASQADSKTVLLHFAVRQQRWHLGAHLHGRTSPHGDCRRVVERAVVCACTQWREDVVGVFAECAHHELCATWGRIIMFAKRGDAGDHVFPCRRLSSVSSCLCYDRPWGFSVWQSNHRGKCIA